jgi:hypothetical protein
MQQRQQEKFRNLKIDEFLVRSSQLEEQVHHLQEIDVSEDLVEEHQSFEEEERDGLLKELVENDTLERLAIFPEELLWDMKHSVEIFANRDRKRGPKPTISIMDSLLIMIISLDFEKLSAFLGVATTTIKSTIERMRPYIYEGLKLRWWKDRLRPKPLSDNKYGYIGLLIDSNSVEIFRPRGHFDEVMMYWDGKNKMYAL